MNWPDAPKDALYTGNSMRGMFLPGETVLLAEVSFETLRKGDVVAVFDRTPSYVHRIVEKNADYAVTMGDNNDHPDKLRLTPESHIMLITGARGLHGDVRRVSGGDAGMKRFRRQQRKRAFRRFAVRLLRPFRPFQAFRIPAGRETRFRDGTIQWNFGDIPVAVRKPDGTTMYFHWAKRLVFRIPVEKP